MIEPFSERTKEELYRNRLINILDSNDSLDSDDKAYYSDMQIETLKDEVIASLEAVNKEQKTKLINYYIENIQLKERIKKMESAK